jgi:hypothetical protein
VHIAFFKKSNIKIKIVAVLRHPYAKCMIQKSFLAKYITTHPKPASELEFHVLSKVLKPVIVQLPHLGSFCSPNYNFQIYVLKSFCPYEDIFVSCVKSLPNIIPFKHQLLFF